MQKKARFCTLHPSCGTCQLYSTSSFSTWLLPRLYTVQATTLAKIHSFVSPPANPVSPRSDLELCHTSWPPRSTSCTPTPSWGADPRLPTQDLLLLAEFCFKTATPLLGLPLSTCSANQYGHDLSKRAKVFYARSVRV